MRRHVDEVAGARHQRRQPLGRRRRSIGRLRRFDRMDVVMIRARMLRIALHHAFERRHDLSRPGLRCVVGFVELPRMLIHDAFGVERGHVEIVGKLLRQLAHRRRVRLLTHHLIARRIGDIALAERGHESLLHVAAVRLPLFGFSNVLIALLQTFGQRDIVDVGAKSERHAPVRHRRRRIERGRALERLERLLVIEAVEKRQPLIEELLRFRVRGLDGAVMRSKIAEQRGAWRGRGRRWMISMCGASGPEAPAASMRPAPRLQETIPVWKGASS